VRQPEHFYGTTTIGERGQAVIPAEARRAMKLKKGEKMLVFGFGPNMLVCTRLESLERIASHMAERLAAIRGIARRTK